MDPDTFKAVVLNAAIQGKLVPQDPNDEPASVLVERIREERQKMIKEGKIKKDKADSFIFKRDNHYYENIGKEERCIDSKLQFDLPECWIWARLGSVCKLTMGQSPEGNTYGTNGMEFHQGKIHFGDLYLEESPVKTSNPLRIVEPNTILMSVRAPVGPTNITPREVCIGRGLCGIKPIICETEYLMAVLASLIEEVKKGGAGSTFDSIGKDEIKQLLVPIPPLEEQKRICDAVREHLNLYRIHREMKEYSTHCANELKQSVLLSAIQGKLVPQDPKDPLVQIQCKNPIVRRDNSYYETNGQKQQCIDDEIPFTIPEKWTWYRLKDVCQYGSSETIRVSEIPSNAKIIELDNIEKNTGRLIGYTSLSTITPTSTHHVFKKGDVLYSKLRPYLNKVVIAEEDGYCTTEIVVIKPNFVLLNKYLQLFLMSPIFINRATHISYGDKMPRLGTKDGKDTLIPIPPYSEQVRIVSKYEQLKELTNQLSC